MLNRVFCPLQGWLTGGIEYASKTVTRCLLASVSWQWRTTASNCTSLGRVSWGDSKWMLVEVVSPSALPHSPAYCTEVLQCILSRCWLWAGMGAREDVSSGGPPHAQAHLGKHYPSAVVRLPSVWWGAVCVSGGSVHVVTQKRHWPCRQAEV